jgi:hypothetical protein
MERREFLLRVGGVILVLPAAGYIVGCGDTTTPTGTTDTTGTTGTNQPGGTTVQTGNTQFTFTSSLVDGHTHTFQLSQSELTTPPSSGITRDTTIAESHLHTVVLSASDLMAIDQNQTVVKVTSISDGHQHSFNFQKAQATQSPTA